MVAQCISMHTHLLPHIVHFYLILSKSTKALQRIWGTLLYNIKMQVFSVNIEITLISVWTTTLHRKRLKTLVCRNHVVLWALPWRIKSVSSHLSWFWFLRLVEVSDKFQIGIFYFKLLINQTVLQSFLSSIYIWLRLYSFFIRTALLHTVGAFQDIQ